MKDLKSNGSMCRKNEKKDENNLFLLNSRKNFSQDLLCNRKGKEESAKAIKSDTKTNETILEVKRQSTKKKERAK